MLSISGKRGTSAQDVGAVAKYPDESKDKAKAPGAVEDYYSQGNDKTPSQWMGGAAEALGLSGPVDREDHMKTLQGLDPKTGQGLVQGAGEDRRYAWDLTFSAPKSVSIVWAIGGEETRADVEAAQTRAVEKVLQFIEQEFAMARRGSSEKGTITHEKAKLLAAAFLHGSSREQDPQIHTHLMLQNLLLREDGTFGTLDGKQMYEWKMALGAMYRAELAREMKEMGFSIEADGDSFRIKGIPKELEEEFSRRRGQIEAKLAEKGLTGGKAAEIAALDTRAAKEILDTEILQGDWDARAAEHGVNKESIEAAKGFEKEAAKEIDRAEILQKLTRMEAVFEEKDLVREAGIALSHHGRGREEVEQEVAGLKRHQDIVKLRGQDGKNYFTTKEMLELEKGILARAREGKEDRDLILSEKSIQAAIARFEREKGFSLSGEQLRAVNYLTREEGLTKIVQGWAGAGKTTALQPVKYALEAEGYQVIGAAIQSKAVKALSGSGIKSQTVAGLLVELEGYTRDDGTKVDPTRKLTNKSVLVIDEAAMVDSRSLARLQALAHEAKAKMILVGDEAQVPPVAAGNPFKSLKKNLDFVEQTENRRQKIEWQKEASRELREGHVGEALERYAVAGMLATAKDRESALTGLVGKWAEEYNPEKPGALLLAASRNVDVDEINRRAKAAMLEKGHLGGIRAEVKTAHGIAEFQAGDRIFFSAISKKYHHFRAGQVANGEFGTLQKIGQDASGTWLFHVKLDQKDGQGPTVVFDPLKYDHFKYGYATTIYKSQGDTLEKTFNYVASAQSLNELYVQLTRHELGAEIAMPEDQVDKMADRAGVELAPTEKMLSLAESLAENEKNGLELPEGIAQDFDLCRSFLNRHASSQMNERTQEQQEELDFGLEKVRSLIGSIRSREKMNALDFIVEPEEKSVTSHEKDQVEKETPEAARESGKEKGRERIRERDGLYLGL